MESDPVPKLVALLRTHAARLNARVLGEMYANPFWDDRYGARGRRFAQDDGASHVAHLVLALEAHTPEMLVSYGQWLQRVLTTRGMCSRHLDENFERLAVAIRDERWEGATLAADYLEQAREGLRRGPEPARSVEEAGPALVQVVVEAGAAGPLPRGIEDVRDVFSYAVDALRNERPDLFAAHLQWFQAWLARRGVDPGALPNLLGVLGRVAPRTLAQGPAGALGGLLRHASAALEPLEG